MHKSGTLPPRICPVNRNVVNYKDYVMSATALGKDVSYIWKAL